MQPYGLFDQMTTLRSPKKVDLFIDWVNSIYYT